MLGVMIKVIHGRDPLIILFTYLHSTRGRIHFHTCTVIVNMNFLIINGQGHVSGAVRLTNIYTLG